MKSWFSALARTRNKLMAGLNRLMPALAAVEPAALDEWESSLIGADVAPRLVGEWMEQLRKRTGSESVRAKMEQLLRAAFPAQPPFSWKLAQAPTVVLIAGVNGSGKTTTAAKLARLARQNGVRPLLAAADTFRAAGSHQLRIWAERLDVEVVGGEQGADSAAVAYDALQAAVARKADIVFVDTAGRMHTKQPLMDELQKVRRSMAKVVPGAPHEAWIVLDATLGNNALVQARTFKEAIALTGAVIAKLDGSSKAGFIFSIQKELGLPIRFVGLGEGADDLAPFDAQEFVKGLMGEV
jgi:fused signal recognition particle receptor